MSSEEVNFNCPRCGEAESVWMNNTAYFQYLNDPGTVLCRACSTVVKDEEKNAYLEALKKLPLEKRIALIEEKLYDQDHMVVHDVPGPFDLIG